MAVCTLIDLIKYLDGFDPVNPLISTFNYKNTSIFFIDSANISAIIRTKIILKAQNIGRH
jgi:hypothetical protein